MIPCQIERGENMNKWTSEMSAMNMEKDYDRINTWIKSNYMTFFEPEPLRELHKTFGACEWEKLNAFSRLIMAWIAFIFGDNLTLSHVMNSLKQETIAEPQEYALYQSLQALLGDLYQITPDEKLQMGLTAREALGDQKTSLFYGNANLTLGQIYSERNAYTNAVSCFQEAHDVFDASNCGFLAIIAEVNMLLNLYKLGAYHQVLEASERAQIRSSRFQEHSQRNDMLAVYHLPMGMALVELGKLDLAMVHLESCKKSIDALNMFHLHGLIEWMVLKVYYKKKAFEALKRELNLCRETFSSLKSPMIEGIFDYYDILLAHETHQIVDSVKLERLTLLLSKQIHSLNFILVEMMVQLQAKGIEHFYTTKMLEQLAVNVEAYQIEPLKPLISQLTQKKTSDLSEREREILEGVALGKTNDEIGKMLYISTGTVKWHLNNIYSKLEVKNRVQALEKYKLLYDL